MILLIRVYQMYRLQVVMIKKSHREAHHQKLATTVSKVNEQKKTRVEGEKSGAKTKNKKSREAQETHKIKNKNKN